MSKSLSNILTVFKIAKVLAKVVFICCIVGGAGCLIALATLPIAEIFLPIQSVAEEIELSSAYPACIYGLLACVGEAIFAFMAERYFGNVLSAGTPFTFEGAKESFRLGIASIIISVAVSVAAGIVIALISLFSEYLSGSDIETPISLSTGLFFLFLSMIFKYGAELRASVQENKQD